MIDYGLRTQSGRTLNRWGKCPFELHNVVSINLNQINCWNHVVDTEVIIHSMTFVFQKMADVPASASAGDAA